MSKISDIKGTATYTDITFTDKIEQIVPTLSSSYTLTHPEKQGVNDQHLVNDGSGNLAWKNRTTRKELADMFLTVGNDYYDTSTITGLSTQYINGALAPNGKIYALSTTHCLIIDTLTDIIDTSTITGSFDSCFGSVLAPNGKIYCIPFSGTYVPIIDPETNTVDNTSITGLGGSAKWIGGCLAPNGKIYCAPYDSATILAIDTSNNTIELFASTTGSTKWNGVVLGASGKLYMVPYSKTDVFVINPNDHSTSTIAIGTNGSTQKCRSGALAPNGKIYCAPNDRTSCLVIDTNNDTFANLGSFGGIDEFHAAVLGPNQKIYLLPRLDSKISIIDTTNDSINNTSISGLGGADFKMSLGIVAPSGVIYCLPRTVSYVMKIFPGEPTIPIERCTSAYFNKF